MKHVLKDLLRRKLLFIFLAIYLITILASTGVYAGSLGLLLVLGAFLIPPQPEDTTIHILRTLPVSSRAVGSAYWTFAVVLFPAFYFFWSLFGEALFLGSGGVPKPGEVLQVLPRASVALTGMGYASMLFLLMPPNALTSSRGIIWEWVLAVLWLSSALPALYLQEAVFAGYREQAIWFYLALLASPIAMAAAYYFAPGAVSSAPRKIGARALKSPPTPSNDVNVWWAFWAKKVTTSLCLALLGLLYITLLSYRTDLNDFESLLRGFGMTLVIIAGMNLQFSYRALRSLPLSSFGLALMLATMSTVAFLAATAVVVVALAVVNRLDMVLPAINNLLYGYSMSVCLRPLMLRFGVMGLVAAMLIIVPMSVSIYIDDQGFIGFIFALLTVLAAVQTTKYLLESSIEVYQDKRLAVHAFRR